MYRFTFFIIKIIAFFSLYIFPYRVMYYVKRIKDIFLSNRFALKIKSGNNFNRISFPCERASLYLYWT